MVFVTRYLLIPSSIKLRSHAKRKFIDSLRLYVSGGAGGMGYPRFGGIGGKGGDVYVVAAEGLTLKMVRQMFPSKRCSAGTGGNSKMHCILGMPGEDRHIKVPTGITVLSDQKKVLGELNTPGDTVLVAEGGSGGGAHNQFNGQKGQAHCVNLDLKIIADVGLVGFPNAGKSTLLKGVSKATPTVADYPFTTLQPNIGILEYDDHRQISMADLPGLVEGAYYNVGLGHKFLKHVERTKLLLFVVDITGFQLSPLHPARSALENVVLLNKELELYREDLVLKPAILAVNKMDYDGAKESFVALKETLNNLQEIIPEIEAQFRPKHVVQFDEIIPVSAKEDPKSMEYLKKRIRDFLDLYAELHRETSDESSNWVREALTESGQKLV